TGDPAPTRPAAVPAPLPVALVPQADRPWLAATGADAALIAASGAGLLVAGMFLVVLARRTRIEERHRRH
ncbi:MAG: LPXTG cell wall anchor domain-containing protein, partial [Phycicoccus sp.]